MKNSDQSTQSDPNTVYQDLLRAVPRLADMYRLVGDQVDAVASDGSRVLIVGAGGGRELLELGKCEHALEIVAVDPSVRNLERARQVAHAEGLTDRVTFVTGTVDDVPPGPPFTIALSLLVMHQIVEDADKAAYLSSIQNKLGDTGLLIHADLCLDAPDGLEGLIQDYMSYAASMGIARQVTQIELDAISQSPPLSSARMRKLFAETHFNAPQEMFRSLWYRCWLVNRSS